MNKNLGNAAQVRQDLENKASAAGTLKEEEKGAAKKEATTPKVKLTDVIIAVIVAAEYLPADGKEKLLAEIDAKLTKVTTTKVTAKSTVYEMLKAAGETGITKDQMVEKFMGREPKPTTGEMISFITNLNWFVQPSFYKKEGWNIFVKEGGFYGLTAKK